MNLHGNPQTKPEGWSPDPQAVRPRNESDERTVTYCAAHVGDALTAHEISRFADERALPGGVRVDLDHDVEALEELADARNYLVWGAQDADSRAKREARVRALGHVVAAFRELKGAA